MLKKITCIIAAVFVITFLGFAITFPIGIKTVFGNITELVNSVEITPQRIDINANTKTLDIDIENYYYYSNNVLIKQSPNETAYIELFDTDSYSSSFKTINVSYPEEEKAKISIEPIYGKFQLNEDTIKKTIVKEIQNYPDAILYIPSTVAIETEYPHFFDNISFQNKQELLEEAKEKERAELNEALIEQKAEELLQEKELEEERIKQKAEELLIERENRESQRIYDNIEINPNYDEEYYNAYE